MEAERVNISAQEALLNRLRDIEVVRVDIAYVNIFSLAQQNTSPRPLTGDENVRYQALKNTLRMELIKLRIAGNKQEFVSLADPTLGRDIAIVTKHIAYENWLAALRAPIKDTNVVARYSQYFIHPSLNDLEQLRDQWIASVSKTIGSGNFSATDDLVSALNRAGLTYLKYELRPLGKLPLILF